MNTEILPEQKKQDGNQRDQINRSGIKYVGVYSGKWILLIIMATLGGEKAIKKSSHACALVSATALVVLCYC